MNLIWTKEKSPRWDESKQRMFGPAELAAVGIEELADGARLPRVRPRPAAPPGPDQKHHGPFGIKGYMSERAVVQPDLGRYRTASASSRTWSSVDPVGTQMISSQPADSNAAA